MPFKKFLHGQEIVFDLQGKESDSALESTVSAFVDQILQEALRLKATDIHLEPFEDCCIVGHGRRA